MITHELDAIEQKEWRIFPGLSLLNERWGYWLFVWLHVPLFAYLLMFIEQENFRWGWSIFSLVHIGLHVLFLKHPKNKFTRLSSWGLILGSGLFGGAYLWLIL